MSETPPLADVAAGAQDELAGELRERAARLGGDERLGLGVLATLDHSPGRLDLFIEFYEHLLAGFPAGPRLKDVIRRRVGELTELRERGELGHGAQPEPPSALAEDERALVRFMDAFAVDHHAIEASVYDDLREHFDAAELTEIFWAVAIVFGAARVGSAIGSAGVT